MDHRAAADYKEGKQNDMRQKHFHRLLLSAGFLSLALLAAGCKHNVSVVHPVLPPQAAPKPEVTLNADKTDLQRGQSATLTWTSKNAIRVELNGTPVNLNGSQQVTPTTSTDYQVVAHGPDGQTSSAGVRITVTEPVVNQPVQSATTQETLSDLFSQNVKDVFFDYDKSNIRNDGQQALTQDADFLKQHPEVKVVIEGHCDDRGSAEYNMALGDRRANAAKDFLEQLGVSADRMRTISYGKEKPFCTDETEECWQQNRRAHIVMAQQQ